MARRNKHTRRKSPPFIMLPHYLIDSPAYANLSTSARAALIEVVRRYNGFNNGRIAMPARTLGARIKRSKDTAARSLKELTERGFIDLAKPGDFDKHLAAEYRLNHLRCDVSFSAPSRAFMYWNRVAVKKIGPPQSTETKIETDSTEPEKLESTE